MGCYTIGPAGKSETTEREDQRDVGRVAIIDKASGDAYALLFTDDGGWQAWFDDAQLEYIDHVGEEGIQKVIAEREARASQERDLAWIIPNWPRIRERVPGATATELMRIVGIPNPWGSQGEGLAWDANWRQTFVAVDPILTSGGDDVRDRLSRIRLDPIDVRLS